MNDDIFDFGFTAVTEEELATVQESQVEVTSLEGRVKDLDTRLTTLYNAVIPLLNNLRANPEKDYIYWPNREAKIDAFETKLSDIVNGDTQ
jgi:hypothetical protein